MLSVVALAVALTTTKAASGQTAPAAIEAASAAVNNNKYNADEEERARGGHRRDLSRQELVEAAARAGMEIVESEEQDWVHADRRLAYEGEGVAVLDYMYVGSGL